MRKAAGVAMVLVGALVLGGCATAVSGTPAPAADTQPAQVPRRVPAPPAQGTKFADAKGRFTIVPPASWKTDTSGGNDLAVRFDSPTTTPAPKGPPFAPSVNVRVVTTPHDLNGIVVGSRAELKRLAAGYEAKTDQPDALPDGTPAHELGGSFLDPASGLTLRNVQLFAVRGGSVYVVTGTALAAGWDAIEKELDSSVRSLTITA